MKLPVSPVTWMTTTTAVYVVTALLNTFMWQWTSVEYIQMVWLLLLALPVFVPMTRVVKMEPIWRLKMIWPFNKQRDVEEVMTAIKDVPKVQPVEEPRPKTHYTVGNDDVGNTVLKIGGDGYYTTTLTMNAVGTRHLIKLLEATIMEDDNE